MSDSEIIRANERQKLLSTVAANLGTALFGAGAVKIYADQALSSESMLWIITGVGSYGARGKPSIFSERRRDVIHLSPAVADLVPAIAGLVAGAGLWALSRYTHRHVRNRD